MVPHPLIIEEALSKDLGLDAFSFSEELISSASSIYASPNRCESSLYSLDLGRLTGMTTSNKVVDTMSLALAYSIFLAFPLVFLEKCFSVNRMVEYYTFMPLEQLHSLSVELGGAHP